VTGQQFWDRIVLWAIPAVGGALALWAGKRRQKLAAAAVAWWQRRQAQRAAILQVVRDLPQIRAEIGNVAQQVGMVQAMVRAQSDLATDGSFECDPHGRNEMVNRTYARLLGVGQGDLVGNRWKDYIHPDDAVAFLEANAKALAEHRVFHKRVRMVRSDGDVITVDVTIIPHPEIPPAVRWYGKVRLVA
jgi:PAS domain S-box-containing protein